MLKERIPTQTGINKPTLPKRGQYFRVSTSIFLYQRAIQVLSQVIYRVTRRAYNDYLSVILFRDLYPVLTTQRI